MNIIYIENTSNIIKEFIKHFKYTQDEIFIFNNLKDALLLIKHSKTLDLIILISNYSETKDLNHLKEITRLTANLKIIYIAENEPKLPFSDIVFLKINNFLKKTNEISNCKNLFLEIEKEIENTKYESDNIFLLENKNLKLINEEIKLSLKLFKDFLFYSETDLDGIITEVSDSFSNFLGFKNYQLLGKKHSIIKDLSENPMKYFDIWQNITIGNIWIGELRCIDKNGKYIWYKTYIFPKKDNTQKK